MNNTNILCWQGRMCVSECVSCLKAASAILLLGELPTPANIDVIIPSVLRQTRSHQPLHRRQALRARPTKTPTYSLIHYCDNLYWQRRRQADTDQQLPAQAHMHIDIQT